MTDKEFKRWMISQLRRLSYRQPQSGRSGAMARARIGRGMYRCELCSVTVSAANIAADHIEPVVSTVIGFNTWDEFISRLFVGADGYQILCIPCHVKKTKEENDVRKAKKAMDRNSNNASPVSSIGACANVLSDRQEGKNNSRVKKTARATKSKTRTRKTKRAIK